MTDVTDIVRRCVSKTVTDEDLSMQESLADPISNVIAGDPRLHRSNPDSSEEITATVNIVDDATKQAQLGSFGASNPKQLREEIVADVKSELTTNLGQRHDATGCKSSLSIFKDSEDQTKAPAFRASLKDAEDNTIGGCSTSQGKTQLSFKRIINWLRLLVDAPHKILSSKSRRYSQQSPQEEFPFLVPLESTSKCGATSMEHAFSDWDDIKSGDYSDQIEFHQQCYLQYLEEFKKHKNRFQVRLNGANYCDDMTGAKAFREAGRHRLQAEQAAWMFVAHLQASTLKSSLQAIRHYQKLGEASPVTNEISWATTDDTIHFAIDRSQLHPEERDKEEISFSDASSFEWDSINMTLNIVWDSFDGFPFQWLREDILGKSDLPMIANSGESDYDSELN